MLARRWKRAREDAVFADGFVKRGDEVLFGDGALLEVLLHELVFAFGDQLDRASWRALASAATLRESRR